MRSRRATIGTVIVGLALLLLVGCTGGGGTSKYAVSGTVTGVDGNGIKGVALSFEGFGTADTDEDGKWRKDGLSGTVKIAPTKDGWAFDPSSRTVSKADSSVNFVATMLEYPLTIQVQGEGTVNQEVVVAAQSTEYEHGTQVQLTAVPATGWRFSHWEGDLQGNTNPETITIDKGKSITAVFAKLEYTLNITIQGEGIVNQEVVVAAQGTEYEHGTPVQLTAVPATGWRFSHWEGDLEGSENPATIMVDSEKSVTAVFVMLEYALTINENGLGTVSVTPNQSTYKYGDQVTLEAFPSTGWTFGEWTGELSGYSNPVSITVNDHMDITAVFVMSVQKAIDSAQDGDTIVIPPGTYYENIDFRGKSITLESEDPYDWDVVEATVLNGQLNGSVVSFASGEGAGTVLRGFTITNGSGRSLEGTLCGGGIFIGESSPTISNNLIMQNTASSGGGIYMRGDSAQPSLTGNIIRNNQGIGVLSDSGAQPTIVANEITGNSGQGIFSSQSHSIITGNTIAGNSAGVILWNGGSATVAENEIKDNRGNGIYVNHYSSFLLLPVLIKDNTIVGNMRGIDAQSSRRTTITGNYIAGNDATRFRYSSDQDGGAIRFGPSSSNTLIVSDNTFEDNKARNGGAISMSGRTTMLQNNIIRNNEAQNGAGVYAISGSTLNLTGNTIEGNVAQNDGGGVYVSFTSSLSILTGNSITGNTPDEVYYE